MPESNPTQLPIKRPNLDWLFWATAIWAVFLLAGLLYVVFAG
jgi:hypothetical protein